MIKQYITGKSFKDYLPIFFLICFSGNPIVTSMDYSQVLLIFYTVAFTVYVLFTIDWQVFNEISLKIVLVPVFIIVISVFQKIIFGFLSFPAVLGFLLKITLAFFTLLYYRDKKIDFVNSYISVIAFIAAVSLPFHILNQFGFYGIPLDNIYQKSLLFYTSFMDFPPYYDTVRNPGMFWEPGAFAGYLILGLIFITLKNRRFEIGPYSKPVFWISVALLTTMSTTGYVIFAILILFYSTQNYKWGKIIVVPVILGLIVFSYYNIDFLNRKIENQYQSALEMNERDISDTRFGALFMDLQYIKSNPVFGNGLHSTTRYRFHPWIKFDDFGHGNGMSNFIAIWGIPFFLFWLYCVYSFAFRVSQSNLTAISALFVTILILQGEQFLNKPIFLSFFVLPFAYKNIYSTENIVHFFRAYLNISPKM